ncbi:MAG: SLC13 family permease [Candidatus Omnitrophica bacterium]|nr:SLC13 family permease [Candidatus Omnitrophota bacterium]
MNAKVLSLIVFIVVYILFVFSPKRRSLLSLSGVSFLILLRAISFKEAFFSINWNVMGIFVGTLIIADLFMESGMPAYLASKVVNYCQDTTLAIISLCVLSGFISAFVENVATLLIMAPIALSLAKKLEINPTNILIAIAISSNLQGCATLIGDPPSMLLGGFAKMSFWDFFFYRNRPSIFFAVELGALFSIIVLGYMFRKYSKKNNYVEIERIKSKIPTVILILLILSLAILSFFDRGFRYSAGLTCIVFAVLGLLWDKLFNSSQLTKRIKSLDWDTTLFLIGVFILVGSLEINGWIKIFAFYLSRLVGNNLFFAYTLLVFISMILSGFVDNVPFLATMLPVAISMAKDIGVLPYLFLFGLLIGASLGGNITPLGASANIVACGILKKEGYLVSFKDFVRIGLPFTLSAIIPAYLFVWFIWK